MARWPDFNGDCLRRGIDPLGLMLPDLCDVIWAWLTDGGDPEAIEELRVKVYAPSVSDAAASPDAAGWSDEENLADFMTALPMMQTPRTR